MKRAVRCLLVAPTLWLCACASGPTYTDADTRALDPVRKNYEKCIGKTTLEVIDGSDDVPFLVQHIVSACDPQLVPVETYLRGRGFNGYFIQRYMQDKRDEASQVTALFILKTKAQQAR